VGDLPLDQYEAHRAPLAKGSWGANPRSETFTSTHPKRPTEAVDVISHHDILSHITDPALEPLKPPDAKKLAREIWENGNVDISGHASVAMADDDLQTTDCLNLVRAGVFNPPDLVNGEWRYQVTTARICIVVVFASETELRIVTAWRIK
jgi:hypothetical protein